MVKLARRHWSWQFVWRHLEQQRLVRLPERQSYKLSASATCSFSKLLQSGVRPWSGSMGIAKFGEDELSQKDCACVEKM